MKVLDTLLNRFVGRDSSVGIVTRWGWTVRGLNPGGEGAKFSTRDHPAAFTLGTVSFSRIKRPERSVEHQPPSNKR